jgi:hypothetical protein
MQIRIIWCRPGTELQNNRVGNLVRQFEIYFRLLLTSSEVQNNRVGIFCPEIRILPPPDSRLSSGSVHSISHITSRSDRHILSRILILALYYRYADRTRVKFKTRV